MGRLFFKKGATLPLTLWARSAEKKARETAWQPLVACAFPGRWRLALSVTADAVPAPPRGEPSMCAAIKLAQSQASPPPLGEVPSKGGRRGQALARSPAFGKPPFRCATGRERRFAVSLAFFRLTPHKVKTVGLWSHLPVRSAQGVCHRQTAPYNPQPFEKG